MGTIFESLRVSVVLLPLSFLVCHSSLKLYECRQRTHESRLNEVDCVFSRQQVLSLHCNLFVNTLQCSDAAAHTTDIDVCVFMSVGWCLSVYFQPLAGRVQARMEEIDFENIDSWLGAVKGANLLKCTTHNTYKTECVHVRTHTHIH